MKAILYFLLVMAPVSSLLAQGQVRVGNHFTGVMTSRVYGPDPNNPFQPSHGNTSTGIPAGTQTYGGALLAGTGYTLAFFTEFDGDYVEIKQNVFRTGVASGLSFLTVVTDPNHPPGTTGVTAIARAWDNKGGTITTWDQAMADPTTAAGESEPFLLGPLGGIQMPTFDPYPIPDSTGLRSFNIYHRGGAFIVGQPEDVIAPAGASAQMQVQVASEVGDPSFQWQRDGTDISGATNATLTFTNIQYADAGGYSAIVTVPSLTLTSRVARLTVQPMIVGIEHMFLPEWGVDAIRLTYDSTANHPVRVEVRSTLRDTWINMGQFVYPTVRNFFFDIGTTNDMRIYRLSIDP